MDLLIVKNVLGISIIIFLLVALFFLLWSDLLRRLNESLKKWISTRKLTEPLEIMRDIDEQIFKMRKIIGSLSLILAAFYVYFYIKL